MRELRSVMNALRAFWASREQRRLVMVALGAASLLALAFGAYTYIDAQREVDTIENKRDTFLQAFPTAEIDGEIKPDLTGASQTDVMWLALQKRNQDRAKTRRSQGMMVAGIGIVGLGLAYLVSPESKRTPTDITAAPASGESSADPGG
jgi:hypothetical protein